MIDRERKKIKMITRIIIVLSITIFAFILALVTTGIDYSIFRIECLSNSFTPRRAFLRIYCGNSSGYAAYAMGEIFRITVFAGALSTVFVAIASRFDLKKNVPIWFAGLTVICVLGFLAFLYYIIYLNH